MPDNLRVGTWLRHMPQNTAHREALRRVVSDFISDLKLACCKSHKGGPGGACICICVASCGGSAACNALYFIKDAIRVRDEHTLQLIEEFL